MRLREYHRPYPSRFDDPGLGHARWMRDQIRITVLAEAAERPDDPRAAVFGRLGSDAFCLVVADDGKVEYLLDRHTATGELDLDLMRRDLGVLARHALERLVDDPADRLWNGLFRAAVWATTTPLCTTIAVGTRHTAVFDSDDGTSAEPPGRPPSLAARLPADRGLARALARAIADPADRDALLTAAGDGTPPVLTTAAVLNELIGADVDADLAIDQIAVAGVWPSGSCSPVHVSPLWWNDLDWYLLAAPRRRRTAVRPRRF
jgi:hypothetical protein